MILHKLLKAGFFAAALSIACLPGCSDDGSGNNDDNGTFDNDTPLSDRDSLYDGWPTNAKLQDEGKADALYPKKFVDLVDQQSPIRSQGRRGVCSIFSATAMMEHLYIKEGTLSQPDFSEQFLQWSVKTELGRFSDTEGSNSNYNLQTINRYGVPEENAWPYEVATWSSSDDAECEGDDRPTKCWTNGSPPDEAMAAKRWHLPRGRWISTRRNSLKAHMTTKKEAVLVGGDFYYQSWNHRASSLTVNKDYWHKGYVTYPNQADKDEAKEKPAGHSILLVGWDDDLPVQKRDGEGNLLTDADGNPDMEKGFWLFKNSWGTGSFGKDNPNGDGYGWLSMEYVEEFLTAYVSGIPKVDVEEICGNNSDDDFDGDADCADSDCAQDAACVGSSNVYTNEDSQDIPDDDAAGISSVIEVADSGTISALAVTVDISHSYKGDLRVSLRKGSQEVVLHNQDGGGEDNLQETFVVSDFNGQDAAGSWTLTVSDNGALDSGRLNSWSLDISTGGSSNTSVYESSDSVPIPDNDEAGAFSNIDVSDDITIAALQVRVTIDHPYKGDLTLKLQRLGEPGEVILQEADASSGEFGTKTFTVSDFNGASANGTWRLTVSDLAASDEGTLTSWALEVTQ